MKKIVEFFMKYKFAWPIILVAGTAFTIFYNTTVINVPYIFDQNGRLLVNYQGLLEQQYSRVRRLPHQSSQYLYKYYFQEADRAALNGNHVAKLDYIKSILVNENINYAQATKAQDIVDLIINNNNVGRYNISESLLHMLAIINLQHDLTNDFILDNGWNLALGDIFFDKERTLLSEFSLLSDAEKFDFSLNYVMLTRLFDSRFIGYDVIQKISVFNDTVSQFLFGHSLNDALTMRSSDLASAVYSKAINKTELKAHWVFLAELRNVSIRNEIFNELHNVFYANKAAIFGQRASTGGTSQTSPSSSL